MIALSLAPARPNETGSLWLWANQTPIATINPRPFSLLAEAKPLLIRIAILAVVMGSASWLPRWNVIQLPLVPSAVGLEIGSPSKMAMLILDPVATYPVSGDHTNGRTDRHPKPEFHFTRFTDSWVHFQY